MTHWWMMGLMMASHDVAQVMVTLECYDVGSIVGQVMDSIIYALMAMR